MASRDKAKQLESWLETIEKKYGAKNFPAPEGNLAQFIHYLIGYSNSSASAKKALRDLQDETVYGGWNEVRVATINEIDKTLDPERIKHSAFLARTIKGFLEGTWVTLNELSFEKLAVEKISKAKELVAHIDMKAAQSLFTEQEERRNAETPASVIPPWATTYILTSIGVESAIPWDAHTERVATRLGLVEEAGATSKKKKALKDLSGGSAGAIRLHHAFVELGKRVCSEDHPKCARCPLMAECRWYKTVGKKAAKTSSSKSSSRKS